MFCEVRCFVCVVVVFFFGVHVGANWLGRVVCSSTPPDPGEIN